MLISKRKKQGWGDVLIRWENMRSIRDNLSEKKYHKIGRCVASMLCWLRGPGLGSTGCYSCTLSWACRDQGSSTHACSRNLLGFRKTSGATVLQRARKNPKASSPHSALHVGWLNFLSKTASENAGETDGNGCPSFQRVRLKQTHRPFTP